MASTGPKRSGSTELVASTMKKSGSQRILVAPLTVPSSASHMGSEPRTVIPSATIGNIFYHLHQIMDGSARNEKNSPIIAVLSLCTPFMDVSSLLSLRLTCKDAFALRNVKVECLDFSFFAGFEVKVFFQEILGNLCDMIGFQPSTVNNQYMNNCNNITNFNYNLLQQTALPCYGANSIPDGVMTPPINTPATFNNITISTKQTRHTHSTNTASNPIANITQTQTDDDGGSLTSSGSALSLTSSSPSVPSSKQLHQQQPSQRHVSQPQQRMLLNSSTALGTTQHSSGVTLDLRSLTQLREKHIVLLCTKFAPILVGILLDGLSCITDAVLTAIFKTHYPYLETFSLRNCRNRNLTGIGFNALLSPCYNQYQPHIYTQNGSAHFNIAHSSHTANPNIPNSSQRVMNVSHLHTPNDAGASYSGVTPSLTGSGFHPVASTSPAPCLHTLDVSFSSVGMAGIERIAMHFNLICDVTTIGGGGGTGVVGPCTGQSGSFIDTHDSQPLSNAHDSSSMTPPLAQYPINTTASNSNIITSTTPATIGNKNSIASMNTHLNNSMSPTTGLPVLTPTPTHPPLHALQPLQQPYLPLVNLRIEGSTASRQLFEKIGCEKHMTAFTKAVENGGGYELLMQLVTSLAVVMRKKVEVALANLTAQHLTLQQAQSQTQSLPLQQPGPSPLVLLSQSSQEDSNHAGLTEQLGISQQHVQLNCNSSSHTHEREKERERSCVIPETFLRQWIVGTYGDCEEWIKQNAANVPVRQTSKQTGAEVLLWTFPISHVMEQKDEKYIETAQTLLDLGADVEVENFFGQTPLASAVANENIRMATFLLNAQRPGQSLEPRDCFSTHNPLQIAIRTQQEDMVRLLLGARFSLAVNAPPCVNPVLKRVYKSPLLLAAEGSSNDIVELVLNAGGSLCFSTASFYTPLVVCYQKHPQFLAQLINSNQKTDISALCDLLTCATIRDDEAAVNLILEHHPHLISQEHSLYSFPLLEASRLGRHRMTRLLLSRGADPDARTVQKKRRNQNQTSATSAHHQSTPFLHASSTDLVHGNHFSHALSLSQQSAGTTNNNNMLLNNTQGRLGQPRIKLVSANQSNNKFNQFHSKDTFFPIDRSPIDVHSNNLASIHNNHSNLLLSGGGGATSVKQNLMLNANTLNPASLHTYSVGKFKGSNNVAPHAHLWGLDPLPPSLNTHTSGSLFVEPITSAHHTIHTGAHQNNVVPFKPEPKPLGNTALHVAAAEGSLLCAVELLRFGARIDSLNEEFLTPLHLSAIENRTYVLACLLSSGASLLRRGANGQTALMKAVYARNPVAVQVLLEFTRRAHLEQKEIDLADGKGRSALLVALAVGSYSVAFELVQLGADLNFSDDAGVRACDYLLNGEFQTGCHPSPYTRSPDANTLTNQSKGESQAAPTSMASSHRFPSQNQPSSTESVPPQGSNDPDMIVEELTSEERQKAFDTLQKLATSEEKLLKANKQAAMVVIAEVDKVIADNDLLRQRRDELVRKYKKSNSTAVQTYKEILRLQELLNEKQSFLHKWIGKLACCSEDKISPPVKPNKQQQQLVTPSPVPPQL